LTVHVPGGRIRVDLAQPAPGAAPEATLTGPAVLVAAGELRADWWAALKE
jgi:diaminopimelate epimerase